MVDNLLITRKYQWTIVWSKMIDLTIVALNNALITMGNESQTKIMGKLFDGNEMMHLANRTKGAIYSGRKALSVLTCRYSFYYCIINFSYHCYLDRQIARYLE